MPDKLFGILEGVAYQVRKEIEGDSAVLRFRFDRGDGTQVPVEMRGDDIRGDLDSGDRVEISVSEKDADETGIRVTRVMNLTTGYDVQVQEKSRTGRMAGFISENSGVAIITALVTAGVSFLLTRLGGGTNLGQTPGPSASASATQSSTGGAQPSTAPVTPPPASGIGPVWVRYLALAVLFDLVALLIVYLWLRRDNKRRGIKRRLFPYLRSRHMLAIVAGLLAGELLAVLIVGITRR
jgi:hypothetical protein